MTLDPNELLGSWRYAREIEDRLADETTTVEGEATFARVGAERIRWHETGEWARPTGPVPVHRSLWLHQRGSGWFVIFDDGHDFHPWTDEAAVEHPCGRDLYVGRVTPGIDEDHWAVEWVVTGPEKDYTMRTSYMRA